jgi:hypothetical protein
MPGLQAPKRNGGALHHALPQVRAREVELVQEGRKCHPQAHNDTLKQEMLNSIGQLYRCNRVL